MAVGAAQLALAYFCFDKAQGVACEDHIGDVLVFAVKVVELEYAVVCGAAVGAFTVQSFVAVDEGFVALSLLLVLDHTCFW